MNPSGVHLSLSKLLGELLSILGSGKLPVSFPRSVGTTPAFYNYLKGSRPTDPGSIADDGTLHFGHQVCTFSHPAQPKSLM